MQYDRQSLFNQAVEVIPTENLFFIEDIVAWLPCDKTTFYRYFSVNLPENIEDYSEEEKEQLVESPTGEKCNGYNYLKGMLDENKIKTKSSIRAKLYKGNKAPELIALYKLICTDEERRSLSMQSIDHTTKGNEIAPTVINLGPGVKPEGE